MALSKLQKERNRILRNNERYERIARKQSNVIELKRADEHFDNCIKFEKEQRKQQEQHKNEIIEAKNNVMLQLQRNNPFTPQQFNIVWDILTDNYEQIVWDFKNGRIGKSDMVKVFQYICQFFGTLLPQTR